MKLSAEMCQMLMTFRLLVDVLPSRDDMSSAVDVLPSRDDMSSARRCTSAT